MRPVPNPVLQRPGGAQQFHESPDEGYHEDDNGSEALWRRHGGGASEANNSGGDVAAPTADNKNNLDNK